jgi:hypothetical protein
MIRDQLQEKLVQLSHDKHVKHQDIDLFGSGWNLQIDIERIESLGGSYPSLTLANEASSGKSLASWANDIVSKSIGLREPLKVLEIDTNRNRALLRSAVPSVRKDEVSYYELILNGSNEANLKRYAFERNQDRKRSAVPMVLTHEVLENFVSAIIETSVLSAT